MARATNSLGQRRVAVTGVGIVSPLGATAAEHWQNLLAGRRRVRFLSAAELPLSRHTTAGWQRWAAAPAAGTTLPASDDILERMSLAVAGEALAQAGLIGLEQRHPDRTGVVLGVSKPALPNNRGGALAVDYPLSLPACRIAEAYECRGGLSVPSVACATGLISIIRGADLIRDGQCDVVIAGSADWSLHPAYLAAYRRMGVMARFHDDAVHEDVLGDDPDRACRPFDRRRSGFMVGSGAAAVVLEDLEHALARGATVLAEILGAGMAGDATSLVETDVSGTTPARVLSDALQRSGLSPVAVDAASLHGTGTRANDLCETAALKQVFGAHAGRVSCFSVKGSIGHLMGAAGSVELATLVMALDRQIVPATVNLEEPDPECDLDYTPGEPRVRGLRTAVKLSLGFGGACAALVLRHWDDA